MSQITRNSLSAPAFFALSASREARSELIDDQTVMTASTTLRHWGLVANILASFHGQLYGTGCRRTCSKTVVWTGAWTIRVPDLVVYCGPGVHQLVCATIGGTISICDYRRLIEG